MNGETPPKGVGYKPFYQVLLPSGDRKELDAKEARLKKLWEKKRLSAQMTSLPEFDEVFGPVRRAFRQAELS